MLADLINRYASQEAAAGDWQGVVSVLTTPSIVVLNDSRWTLGTIQLELGVETARTVAAGMKAVGDVDPIVGSAYIAMSTVGMQLHTDDRQAMVDIVGQSAGWSSDLIKSLKELGKKVISPVEQADIPAPTPIEAENAWIVDTTRKTMSVELQKVQAKSSALNAWLDDLDTSVMTPQEVQAYCDALLASEDGNPADEGAN